MNAETAHRPLSFGDYALARFLGEGRQGRVFAAKPPPRLGSRADLVVVKVLREGTKLERFRAAVAELQRLLSARSSTIITVFEAGLGRDESMYVAMEFAPQGSLAAPLPDLSREDVLRAVASVARGVHALHEVGILHGAVRPTNVLLAAGEAKLAEPDLADLLWPGHSFYVLHPASDLQYVDPCVIRGEAPSRASDIWALGATLHVALTGKPIFYQAGPDLLHALRLTLTTVPIIDRSLTPEERDLIQSCLAADPGDRPSDALEVAEDIERMLGVERGMRDQLADRAAGMTVGQDAARPEWKSERRPARAEWRPHPRLGAGTAPPAGNEDPPGFEIVAVAPADPMAPRDAVARARRRGAPPPTIEGILCNRGHLSHPEAWYCATCGMSLLQGPRRFVRHRRPVLGVLILDDGTVFCLDANYVIGREPSRDADVQKGTVRPLRLDGQEHRVAPAHAEIRLDGWRVLLKDRASGHGTFIRSPGAEEWTRLEGDQLVELRSRTVIRLGERELVFGSNRER